MFFLVVCCIIDLLISSQCSKVYEVHKYVQASQLDVKHYCSKIGSCEPGTHVACTYFFRQNSMGPKCDTNAKPIKMTNAMQTQILTMINAIRKRLAEGIENGNKQEVLPRAYGMVKLQWDQELADLAELWANQCEDGYDKCRSTEKFPNVAQTDYSFVKRRHDEHDSWENILKVNKIEKIIETSIDYWRRGKEGVTREMILNSGYFLEYLQMIHGQNTHLGCGMAAYTSNSFYNKTQNPSHLIIKLVCNWSHQLKRNSMVYDIDPPQGRGGGRSKNCGCYSGQTEGDGCLCILENTTPPDVEVPKVARSDATCDDTHPANVVILPIFAFQDGNDIPLSKLRNATANYIRTLPVKTDTRYYDGGPVAQETTHARPLGVRRTPIARNHMVFESIQNQEQKRPRNLKSRDLYRLKELVQEYLVSDKRPIHSPVIPVDLVAIQSAAKMPRFMPVKVDKSVSYDYTGYFDNPVKPRTRRVSFGLQDPNYRQTPDIRNINDKELNKVLIALLEDLVYHGNVNNLIAKKHDAEVDEERDYNNLIRLPKQMKQSNLIENLEHYEDEARVDNNIYTNNDYERLIRDESREISWPTIRKQSPLTHTLYDNNNYDYYSNDYDYEDEKVIRNIERDILQSNLDKDVKYLIETRR